MEICFRSLKGQYIKYLKRQYVSNYFTSWSDVLEILETTTTNHMHSLFYKIWSNFSKGQCVLNHIVLDSNFSKDAWNRNKTQGFDGNLKIILETTIWVRLYYHLKIDANFVKWQYGLNCIVLYDFIAEPNFRKLNK